MLAKNVNDNACFLNKRGACEFFASKLAPTAGIGANTLLHRAPQALSPLNLHCGKRRLVTRLLQYIPGFLRRPGLPLWP